MSCYLLEFEAENRRYHPVKVYIPVIVPPLANVPPAHCLVCHEEIVNIEAWISRASLEDIEIKVALFERTSYSGLGSEKREVAKYENVADFLFEHNANGHELGDYDLETLFVTEKKNARAPQGSNVGAQRRTRAAGPCGRK